MDVKTHVRSNFPFKRSLSFFSILQNITKETIFGYVQCDFNATDILKAKFTIFSPIFKNIDVPRNDIEESIKTYAEKTFC